MLRTFGRLLIVSWIAFWGQAVAQEGLQTAGPSELVDDAELAPDLLTLDGETSVDVGPSANFNLGPEGTIEFLVAADWEADPGYFPCVLASRASYSGEDPEGLGRATRYSIHIRGDRREIGMWNGAAWEGVPFDFSDGEFHWVFFITRGDHTIVVVDGEVRGVLPLGYGVGTDLPLHVGSADGATEFFRGSVSGVRLWNRALAPGELAPLAEVHDGPVPTDEPIAGALLAFSEFRDPASTIVVVEDEGAGDEAQ